MVSACSGEIPSQATGLVIIFLISFFPGFLKVGLRIVFLNYNLRSRSLAHCIHASEASYLVVGDGKTNSFILFLTNQFLIITPFYTYSILSFSRTTRIKLKILMPYGVTLIVVLFPVSRLKSVTWNNQSSLLFCAVYRLSNTLCSILTENVYPYIHFFELFILNLPVTFLHPTKKKKRKETCSAFVLLVLNGLVRLAPFRISIKIAENNVCYLEFKSILSRV